MNKTPDLIERFVAIVSRITSLTEEQERQADALLRKEVAGSGEHYIRKRSPFLHDVIRARYDGTMATTRRLAAEYEISETTVRRIGLRHRRISPASSPPVTPRIAGKKDKPVR